MILFDYNSAVVFRGRLAPAEETVGPMIPTQPATPQAPHAKRHHEEDTFSITPPTSPVLLRHRLKGGELSLDLLPVTPSPVSRKRRRKHLVVDDDIQLDRESFRRNMEIGGSTSQPMVLPNKTPLTQNLFQQPGRKDMMRPNFTKLWKRCAVSLDCPETDSQKGRIAWTLPDLDVTSSSDQMTASPSTNFPITADMEMPQSGSANVSYESAELGRLSASRHDASDVLARSLLSLRTAGEQNSLSLSTSKLSFSQRSQRRGADQSLLLEESAEASMRPLQRIMEGQEEGEDIHVSPYRLPPLTEGHGGWEGTTQSQETEHFILSEVVRLTAEAPRTTFRQVCPITNNTRTTAARCFGALLDICAEGLLRVKQDMAYGDIYLARQ